MIIVNNTYVYFQFNCCANGLLVKEVCIATADTLGSAKLGKMNMRYV